MLLRVVKAIIYLALEGIIDLLIVLLLLLQVVCEVMKSSKGTKPRTAHVDQPFRGQTVPLHVKNVWFEFPLFQHSPCMSIRDPALFSVCPIDNIKNELSTNVTSSMSAPYVPIATS